MSDPVLIVLIIAIAVVLVLVIFRRQLSSFFLKANKEGLEARLETRETSSTGRADVTISRNKQIGRGNVIEVGRGNVGVEDNTQLGEDQQIIARPDPAGKDKNH